MDDAALTEPELNNEEMVSPRRKTAGEGGRPGKVRSIGKLRSMVREMLARDLDR